MASNNKVSAPRIGDLLAQWEMANDAVAERDRDCTRPIIRRDLSQESIIKTYQGRDPGVSACLVEIEGFIGDMDGKTVGTAMDDNTFSDDGTVDASSAVIAINGLTWSLERREAENERVLAALTAAREWILDNTSSDDRDTMYERGRWPADERLMKQIDEALRISEPKKS